MTDDQLLTRFEACDLDASRFSHRDHLRVAWRLLVHLPLHEAAGRYIHGLRRFTRHVGKPDLYHETITWAYLVLLNEQRHRLGAIPFEILERDQPGLLDHRGGVLTARYSPEMLRSPAARAVFVLPDRADTRPVSAEPGRMITDT